MIALETIAGVATRIESDGLDEANLTALRQTWPDIHFTLCADDDVPARLKPIAEGAGYGIYLISSASHCIGFTTQPEAATGLVLARRIEED